MSNVKSQQYFQHLVHVSTKHSKDVIFKGTFKRLYSHCKGPSFRRISQYLIHCSYLIPLMLSSSTYNHTSWQNPCIWLVDHRHPCHRPHQSWLSLYSIANLLYPARKPHSSCWPGKTPVLLLVIKWWRRHDLVAFCFEVFQCHYTLHTGSGWWWMNLENNTPIVKPSELPYDKTNKVACAPSEDSDQPGHPPSLIRVFAVRSMGSWGPKVSSCWQWGLWSDWAECWSELSLGKHAILLVLSWGGSSKHLL